MPDLHGLALFVAAGVLLNLTPGVDLLYILGQAGARGLKAAVVATAGVCAGCSVHIAAATLGVSALLATSATAFTALKLIGAAYLLYLGVRLWLPTLARSSAAATGTSRCADPRPSSDRTDVDRTDVDRTQVDRSDFGRIFIGGFLTNALNPKVALFFLAFLPQFIAPGSTAQGQLQAMLLLGLLFVVNSFFVNVALAWSVTRLARRLGHAPVLGRWLQRLTGSLFVYFGLRLLGSRLPD